MRNKLILFIGLFTFWSSLSQNDYESTYKKIDSLRILYLKSDYFFKEAKEKISPKYIWFQEYNSTIFLRTFRTYDNVYTKKLKYLYQISLLFEGKELNEDKHYLCRKVIEEVYCDYVVFTENDEHGYFPEPLVYDYITDYLSKWFIYIMSERLKSRSFEDIFEEMKKNNFKPIPSDFYWKAQTL
ncbi:hypothetical protein [Aureivirga sp. CE67]|uniref:hypothetical protein n=1 Tax=Aureivirga sp. CE67 TaxID=1788983 RepID=UPI0018CABDF6|nr:hypothetical protein [Aureivirga sp. CE67]